MTEDSKFGSKPDLHSRRLYPDTASHPHSVYNVLVSRVTLGAYLRKVITVSNCASLDIPHLKVLPVNKRELAPIAGVLVALAASSVRTNCLLNDTKPRIVRRGATNKRASTLAGSNLDIVVCCNNKLRESR